VGALNPFDDEPGTLTRRTRNLALVLIIGLLALGSAVWTFRSTWMTARDTGPFTGTVAPSASPTAAVVPIPGPTPTPIPTPAITDPAVLVAGHPYANAREIVGKIARSPGVTTTEALAIAGELATLLETSNGEPYERLRIEVRQQHPNGFRIEVTGRVAGAGWSDDLRLHGPLGGIRIGEGKHGPQRRYAIPDAVIPALDRLASTHPEVAALRPTYSDPVVAEWDADRPGIYTVRFGRGGCDVPATSGRPIARACTSFMLVTVDARHSVVIGVAYEVTPV
jgi:hypothetical protein